MPSIYPQNGDRMVAVDSAMPVHPVYTVIVQVARRCWSGNKMADETARAAMSADDLLRVTLPHYVDDAVDSIIDAALNTPLLR